MTNISENRNTGREVVLDTETTGLKIEDRVIELGMIELQDKIPTGRTYHMFFNPDGTPVHPDALAVHGITNQFLEDKPTFGSQISAIFAFLQNDPIVAHNASFDIRMINNEIKRCSSGQKLLPNEVIDTLKIAREKFPNADNSLNGLCRRFKINLDRRNSEGHGALLDCELLAECYEELTIGRNRRIMFDVPLERGNEYDHVTEIIAPKLKKDRGIGRPNTQELKRWQEFNRTCGFSN